MYLMRVLSCVLVLILTAAPAWSRPAASPCGDQQVKEKQQSFKAGKTIEKTICMDGSVHEQEVTGEDAAATVVSPKRFEPKKSGGKSAKSSLDGQDEFSVDHSKQEVKEVWVTEKK